MATVRDNSILSYCSTVKVFAGKVRLVVSFVERKTGFFQKAGFPQNPFINSVAYPIIPRSSIPSAICTTLVAAPLRRLSATIHRFRPF